MSAARYECTIPYCGEALYAAAELLEAWLAPTDVATFREEFFGRRALFRDGARERLEPVLALSSWNVREIFAQQTSKFIAWFQATDGRHVTAEVSPEAAQRLYLTGITMYIRRVLALAPITTAMATALAVPEQNIECTLFCNQPGARTRMHFDPVDTITMQVTGNKRWRIARNLHAPDPTEGYATLDAQVAPELRLYAHDGFPTHMPADAEEYLLTPGSVLYVPRGFWHETESDEASISLHVHHTPVPWVDAVLVTLRAKLLRDRAWRTGAHDLWDASRRPQAMTTAATLLRDLAAARAPQHILGASRHVGRAQAIGGCRERPRSGRRRLTWIATPCSATCRASSIVRG